MDGLHLHQGPTTRPLLASSLADRWSNEAWSIVLHISAAADAEGVMVADIRMLAEGDAPKELLSSGSRFDLFEGRRHVASGEVL